MENVSLCVHLIGFHCVVPASFGRIVALIRIPLVGAAKSGCKTTEKRNGTPEVFNPPTTLRYDSICIACGRLLCDLDSTLNMGRVHTHGLSHFTQTHTHWKEKDTGTIIESMRKEFLVCVMQPCLHCLTFFFLLLQTMNAGGI